MYIEQEKARNKIGSLPVIEEGRASDDNLSIAMAYYFSGHPDCPQNDEFDDEIGWGKWVLDQTENLLDRIVKESCPITCAKYTFTDSLGREFNDKIPVGISPSDLERFYQTYKSKAETCRDYDTQKTYHKIVDFLSHHLSEYHSARKIFDATK